MKNLLATAMALVLSVAALAAGANARTTARRSAAHRHSAESRHSPALTPAGHYSWEGTQTDLTTIVVQPFLTSAPGDADPLHADFLRRMNLENGLEVHGTHWIARSDVRSRDLFILDITQSLEGGFDSVNLYDRGLLSWGIMQWSARSGSLAQSLIFIKRRLWASGRKRVWDKTFTANGIDVDSDGLIVYGKPLKTAAQMRLAFRGSLKIGNYDPKMANHWADTMARAGRQPAVEALQVEYAAHIVDAVLNKRLSGLPYHAAGRSGLTASDLAANDPFAEALIFALWTNNPRHAFSYVCAAAGAARSASICDDPSLWAPGAFSAALLNRCQASRFGNWSRRAQAIEAREALDRSADADGLTPFEAAYQSVLAARKQRRIWEIASRHQSVARPKAGHVEADDGDQAAQPSLAVSPTAPDPAAAGPGPPVIQK
jgi:hypothetical protein